MYISDIRNGREGIPNKYLKGKGKMKAKEYYTDKIYQLQGFTKKKTNED